MSNEITEESRSKHQALAKAYDEAEASGELTQLPDGHYMGFAVGEKETDEMWEVIFMGLRRAVERKNVEYPNDIDPTILFVKKEGEKRTFYWYVLADNRREGGNQ